jgi:hypothetical protein
MSAIVSKSSDEINKSMVKFLPELSSEYAKYPMHYKKWYDPTQKGPKGESCFIKSSDNNISVIKMDYAYCKRGPLGPGYYSLMTKVSYVNLYTKLLSMSPLTCSIGCNSADRKAMDEYDDVKRVIYGRHFSPRPDDTAAGKRALDESEGIAIASYWGGN